MTTLTIRAADSATALDEVQRRLGPDALILSTRQSRGMVEVVAGIAEIRPTRPATLPQARPYPGPAPAELPANPVRPGFSTQRHRPDFPAHGPQPDSPADQPRPNFSAQLVQAMAPADTAMPCLPPNLSGRVVLVGPPGSGRSLLAARLAAAALRDGAGLRPVLIAPRPDLLTGAGPLAGWARLMGLDLHRPIWPQGLPRHLPPPDPDRLEIIDLSDMPLTSADPLAAWRDLHQTQIWLVLPTGLHPDCHARFCPALHGIVRLIVLTRADLCPPTADDLALGATHGIAPALIAEGTGLMDALSPLPLPMPVPVPVPVQVSAPEPGPQASPVPELTTPASCCKES
jgi:hypothetical protein